jgi:TonB family protein
MRLFLRVILSFTLAFVAGTALVASIKRLDFGSAVVNDISPVKLPAEAFGPYGPCSPDSSTEWSIKSIPVAAYTAEAQRRNAVGTVRLAIYFDSDGKVSIAGVISKLPYGLTEASIKAARQIKFKPALSCNRPVSEPAEIHYEFPGGQGRAVQL